MKAEIKLVGPVHFGMSQFELQAVVNCADGVMRTIKWSQHWNEEAAVEYRDNFNNFPNEEKEDQKP